MQRLCCLAGEGDVEGVGGPFWREDAGLQLAVAQADGFDGDVDKLGPRQVFLIDLANAFRRVLKFIDDDGRDDQLKAPGFDLREELRARRVDPRIEDAAVNHRHGWARACREHCRHRLEVEPWATAHGASELTQMK